MRLGEIRRDFVLALAVPVLTLILARDGALSRAEGLLLLTLFALWLTLVVRQGMDHRRSTLGDAEAQDAASRVGPARVWLFLILGLACLILAGRLFVTGASGVAEGFGVHPYVIGALVVAIGTSLPELVTALIARWRGHDDVGLGTLLGSNLFNGLAIVGVAAAIHPIRAPLTEVAVVLGFGVLTLLLILPRAGVIPRWRGPILPAAYGTYVAATLTL